MNYYTSPTAVVTAGTSQSNPTTLSDACMKAVVGDTVYLAAGTYRGTYTPQSGVSLLGVGNPTISGMDVVTGPFTKLGSYYTARVSSLEALGGSMGADQVLIDGVEVLESRWPLATTGTRGDIRSWAEATAVSLTTNGSNYEATYTVAGLPPGSLTDCKAHVLNGSQWISVGGQVIASTASTVTIRFPSDGNDWNVPMVGSRFYLWGGANLPHGFHIFNGVLHLASDPGTKKVEIKARHWGVDLSKVVDVTIRGIQFQSCSIRTDDSTRGVTLDSLSIQNMSHFQAPTTYWWGPPCINLRDGSKITNSIITSSAGGVLQVEGNGCQVDNLTVLDSSYSGCCQSAVGVQGSNHTVSRSTLGMAGAQGLLDMRNATNCTFRGCEVYGGGGILTDGGTVMCADSHVTTDQGNKIVECYIHDTRGRGDGPNLYGNAGLYVEGNAPVTVRECYIKGATSNDLQVVPLGGTPGQVLVEKCTLGTLSISYSGTATTIPITYKDNIAGSVGGSLTPATVTGNAIDTERLAGNTQACNVLSTLDVGGHPGPYSPPGCGARGGQTYYWGAYSTSLDYTTTATRTDSSVRVKLVGAPPPDGFTVKCGAVEAKVRQYDGYLVATFPPTISTGEVTLSAPSYSTKTLRVVIPPNTLTVIPSTGNSIRGVGFKPLTNVIVTITSAEESWDVPLAIPVGAYIAQGLMRVDGTGIKTKEGLPLYVDQTYPVGGVHVWVRVPRIPVGVSRFTIVLGGTDNVSSARDTFMEAAFHLGSGWNKEECEGLTVKVVGSELVIAGTTTPASKFGGAGIRVKDDYQYPRRPFSWDSYVSMAPNSADYWWAVVGNNSFLLGDAGSRVSGGTDKPSTMGREFTRRLVSNVQLPASVVWMEDLVVIHTRVDLPEAKGIFSLTPSWEGLRVEWKYHYIRARGVPESGVMPTTSSSTVPQTLRLWVGGQDYTSLVAAYTDTTITLNTAPPLPPGTYDLRVMVGEVDYTLRGGYVVGDSAQPSPPARGELIPNPLTTKVVQVGPLADRPLPTTNGMVYVSSEGTCYTSSNGMWLPYQVVDISAQVVASPITGTWPLGTVLAKVGSAPLPGNMLTLSGAELPLSQYGSLYAVMGGTLTNGAGMVGTTHFLLPNYRRGIVSIPGAMVVGFGGWVTHLPGKDYPLEWVVVAST